MTDERRLHFSLARSVEQERGGEYFSQHGVRCGEDRLDAREVRMNKEVLQCALARPGTLGPSAAALKHAGCRQLESPDALGSAAWSVPPFEKIRGPKTRFGEHTRPRVSSATPSSLTS